MEQWMLDIIKENMPNGCKCDPNDWCDYPPPVCNKYVKQDKSSYCVNCEHNEECHIKRG